jgi:hypothetical protein
LADGQCSKNGYTIATINGINTTNGQAGDNMIALNKILGFSWNNQEIYYQYLYNPTHDVIVDSVDTLLQKYFDQKNLDIDDSDSAQMLTDASNKVTTQKLLLVGHSQGNFYANTFYDAVADMTGGVPSESIGVYGVASPSDRVAGSGSYLTSDTDVMIAGVVAKFPFTHILKPNAHIEFNKNDGDILGHDFSKIYLKYEGVKIVSDIQSSLDKLKNNNIQDENSPCLNPPKLTLTQKIQGTVLATLDHVTIPAQNALVYIVSGAIKTALAAGKATVNLTGSAISAVDSFFITTTNDANNLAVNNSAGDVINAINQNSSQNNPIPIITAENSAPVVSIPLVVSVPPPSSPPSLPFVGKGETDVSSSLTSTLSSTSTDSSSSDNSNNSNNSNSNDSSDSNQNPPTPPTPPVIPTSPTPDTTPPVITVLGDSTETVLVGSTYVDAGATAFDKVDGTLKVTTKGSVDTTTPGTNTITYMATDSSGNSTTSTRTVKVFNYKYIPKNSFGKKNGDNNDWQVWMFNGSNIYDWTDTYVNNYLREQFKIQAYSTDGIYCSQCLQRGIFDRNPQEGFNSTDVVSLSGLEDNPQNSKLGVTYNVSLQWDSAGYTYTISHNNITDSTGHTDIANVNSDMWVGWDTPWNSFRTFPSGIWQGIPYNSPVDRTGGNDLMLQPYPVYKNQTTQTNPTLSLPNEGVYAGTGISPTRGRTNLTPFTFQITYTDKNNIAPQNVQLHVTNEATGVTLPSVDLQKIAGGADALSDGNFANGETYTAGNLLYDTGNYDYYFSANDSTGNTIRIPENDTLDFGIIPSTYTYLPKDSFGTNNGDGNNWQVWVFSGSNVYNWSNTYVNSYLLQQFKIQTYNAGGAYCSQCLQRGIFNHDPQKGFETADIVSLEGLESNPQNSRDGVIYDVSIEWDSAGYTYTISHDGVTDSTGHTDIANVNSDMWVGWDGSQNNFKNFPAGSWDGIISYGSLGLTGGDNMMLQPYPVYDSSKISSPLKQITAFSFSNLTPNVVGVINETDHTISLTVPYGTDVTTLIPMITISANASIIPNNNNKTAQDFTRPVTYLVTAENKSTQNYVVTVTVAPDPNIPSKLKIITPVQSIPVNTASSIITVESQNSGETKTVVSQTTDVSLASSSTTGTFASASATTKLCDSDWKNISIVTISKGDANRSFCYKDSVSGTPTITVSASGFSSDSQVFTIN